MCEQGVRGVDSGSARSAVEQAGLGFGAAAMELRLAGEGVGVLGRWCRAGAEV